MKWARLLLICFFLQPSTLLAKKAANSFFFNPAAFYSNRELDYRTNSSKNKYKEATTYLNLNAGYGFGNGFLLGLKYYNEQVETNDNSTTAEVSITGWGPAVGWDFEQLKLMAGLFMIEGPRRIERDGPKTVYSEGDGIIYDAMYLFDVGNVGIGPQLSLVTLTYDKKEVNGVSDATFKSRKDTLILPSVSLFVSF